jgi:hypothetical protein
MMTRADLSALAQTLGRAVKELIGTVEAALSGRIQILERQIKEIPAGPKGDQGDAGEKGEKGDRGVAGDPGNAGPQGEVGPRGEKGEPGESIKGERGEKGETGERGLKGDTGSPGERGEKGEPGLSIKGETGERGEKGLDGKDGRDGRDGLNGKDGRDGEPGRNATQIDYLPAIDPAKTYPRGTHARYNGGTIWAARNTAPIADGFEKSGWEVLEDGIASIEEIPSEDPREFSIEFKRTSGAATVIKRYWPVPMYEQIWREGADYRKGAMVTRDGSTWHCNQDHTKVPPGTPNSADWTLCVKRGQNGKDGKDGERGPEGPAGKDLRPMGGKW